MSFLSCLESQLGLHLSERQPQSELQTKRAASCDLHTARCASKERNDLKSWLGIPNLFLPYFVDFQNEFNLCL